MSPWVQNFKCMIFIVDKEQGCRLSCMQALGVLRESGIGWRCKMIVLEWHVQASCLSYVLPASNFSGLYNASWLYISGATSCWKVKKGK